MQQQHHHHHMDNHLVSLPPPGSCSLIHAAPSCCLSTLLFFSASPSHALSASDCFSTSCFLAASVSFFSRYLSTLFLLDCISSSFFPLGFCSPAQAASLPGCLTPPPASATLVFLMASACLVIPRPGCLSASWYPCPCSLPHADFYLMQSYYSTAPLTTLSASLLLFISYCLTISCCLTWFQLTYAICKKVSGHAVFQGLG